MPANDLEFLRGGRSEVRLRTTLEKDSWSERFAAFSNSSASTSIAVVFVGIY
jgi:hypothetical protein